MPITAELETLGLQNLGEVAKDLSTPKLYEEIIKNREGRLAHLGALIVRTAHFAERSARDAFVVDRPELEGHRWVAGSVRTVEAERFDKIFDRVKTYLHNRDLYIQDCYAGAGDDLIGVRVITEMAWHSLFTRSLYRPATDTSRRFEPDITIIHVPRFQAIPETDGTASSSFVAMDPGPRRLILIGGTVYGGELRQAIGNAYRFIDAERQRSAQAELPVPLHCAVNVDSDGNVAGFLGRTGNGKTALATEPECTFIGDHELRWTDNGLTSIERGCYARALAIDDIESPALWECTRRFGAILENVTLDHKTRRFDLGDARLTENTRAVFPSSHLPKCDRSGRCAHPKHLFLLTKDNLGVLPAIARLSPDEAVFAFLTSYVSSLAETEARPGDVRPSVQKGEVKGSGPSMASVPPEEYAKRFMDKIVKHNVQCWFMNTGFIGEPMGMTERIALQVSRTLVRAARSGALDDVEYTKDPLFQFEVPKTCPGVSPELLDPRLNTVDQGDYEMRANRLALDFIKGFERFEVDMPESVREMVANVPILDTDFDLMEQIGFVL